MMEVDGGMVLELKERKFWSFPRGYIGINGERFKRATS